MCAGFENGGCVDSETRELRKFYRPEALNSHTFKEGVQMFNAVQEERKKFAEMSGLDGSLFIERRTNPAFLSEAFPVLRYDSPEFEALVVPFKSNAGPVPADDYYPDQYQRFAWTTHGIANLVKNNSNILENIPLIAMKELQNCAKLNFFEWVSVFYSSTSAMPISNLFAAGLRGDWRYPLFYFGSAEGFRVMTERKSGVSQKA